MVVTYCIKNMTLLPNIDSVRESGITLTSGDTKKLEAVYEKSHWCVS